LAPLAILGTAASLHVSLSTDFLIITKETITAATQQPLLSGTPRHYSPMLISRIAPLGRFPASLTSICLKKKKTQLEINTVVARTHEKGVLL
jgi:hypothetical protein